MENIMERVKTFEDAINVLGEEHPFVKEYRIIDSNASLGDLAYLKLRIIVAALNEGWKPKYIKNEIRYYPYFYFYAKEEYDAMDEDERDGLILLNKSNNDVYASLAASRSPNVSSYAYAFIGYQLAFKTKELALYAGKQFIDLYYDFYRK